MKADALSESRSGDQQRNSDEQAGQSKKDRKAKNETSNFHEYSGRQKDAPAKIEPIQ
jgi:hypothetical protein